jgi:hypothetical protein
MILPRLGVFTLFLTVTVACTTTDPYTGETTIDEGSTAALAGLAVLGAAAYAASSDDDDDRHRHHRQHPNHNRDRDYSSRSRPSDVICHDYTHRCYRNGQYSSKWTNRVYD